MVHHARDVLDRQYGYQQRVLARAFGMIAGKANGKIRKPVADRHRIDLPCPTGKIKESSPLGQQLRPELHFVVLTVHHLSLWGDTPVYLPLFPLFSYAGVLGGSPSISSFANTARRARYAVMFAALSVGTQPSL